MNEYTIQKRVRCTDCTDGKFGVFPEGHPELVQMFVCQRCNGAGFKFEQVAVDVVMMSDQKVLVIK
jgi:hypothetical protein